MSTRLICADVLDGLRQLDSDSVHCVVTSPPYWGLRNYGIEPSVWGGEPSCPHAWSDQQRGPRGDLLPGGESKVRRIGTTPAQQGTNDGGHWCERCGAWRGCLGLEPTPGLFVEHIAAIFRDVRRVLHPSGTLWLNFGDCYVTHPHGDGPSTDPKYPVGRDRSEGNLANRKTAADAGLKNKDLVMMPARIALALQADGWYLRQQIPWLKRNCMPESCTDRPTTAVEYIYLLSKSETYFYDRAAAMVAQAEHERTRRLREQANGLDTHYQLRRDHSRHGQVKPGANGSAKSVAARHVLAQTGVRARRNADWYFDSLGELIALVANPQPFTLDLCTACGEVYDRREFRRLPHDRKTKTAICACGESGRWLSHFATFPEAMVEPCIALGASEHGACSHCGAPYERVVEKPNLGDWNADPSHKLNGVHRTQAKKSAQAPAIVRASTWRPTCNHPLFSPTAVPCIVLDPFGGSGTTGVVATRLGRDAILIDRNPYYILLQGHRLAQAATRSVSSVTPPVGSPAIGPAGLLSQSARGARV